MQSRRHRECRHHGRPVASGPGSKACISRLDPCCTCKLLPACNSSVPYTTGHCCSTRPQPAATACASLAGLRQALCPRTSLQPFPQQPRTMTLLPSPSNQALCPPCSLSASPASSRPRRESTIAAPTSLGAHDANSVRQCAPPRASSFRSQPPAAAASGCCPVQSRMALTQPKWPCPAAMCRGPAEAQGLGRGSESRWRARHSCAAGVVAGKNGRE